MKEEIKSRIDAARAMMKAAGVAAVVVPQSDPHLSEYLASHWQVRRWLSGFTGSAGTLVITARESALFTDSRYFLQAADQLAGTGIELMKEGLPGTPSIPEYLSTRLLKGDKVGTDGMVMSLSEYRSLRGSLEAHGISLDASFDVAALWDDRPALPKEKIFVHEKKYAGLDACDKIAQVLDNASRQDATSVFISALDEIAWLLNIRCRDVKYNPVTTSFVYASRKGTTLFVDLDKVGDNERAYLRRQGVEVMPYDAVKGFLAELPADARVLIEPTRTACELAAIIGQRAVEGTSAVAMLKACKDSTQVAGVKAAMARDGVALVKSVMEIEKRLATGVTTTEMDIAEILRRHRSAQPLFFDESFGTIAGYGPHGAIVHYEADEETNSTIEPHGLLLIDSGAQYLDGTTDITRTIALGTPTEMERRDFTLVMKGHIALGTAIFPEGTAGMQLDALARQFLWKEGLSYLHGTGHGVGHFLNVHEGPHSIRLNYVPAPLSLGMITSNEPGLYREGIHGIRCENLVLTVPAMTTEFGNFYKFETITLFPFDLNLFDTSIMTDDEISWLNEYHQTVRRVLSPALSDDERAWLEAKTQPLKK